MDTTKLKQYQVKVGIAANEGFDAMKKLSKEISQDDDLPIEQFFQIMDEIESLGFAAEDLFAK